MMLLYGKSDATIFTNGAGMGFNNPREAHPNILTKRLWFMPLTLDFACPLPSKMSTFYNLITPLDFFVWMVVMVTVIVVSFVAIIINQVYKTLPGKPNKWSW